MSIADAAFGYAVNSINYPTVAAQFDIQFLSPPENDDILIAEGKVLKIGRRAVFCEMIVTNQQDKLIARASGTGIPLAEGKKSTNN
jgi:acyl-CoA thioesterase